MSDSYEAWLAQQVKQTGKSKASKSVSQSTAVPVDTFNAWLKSQPVVEKEQAQAAAPTEMPANTYETWMKKQTAEKQAAPEEESAPAAQAEETNNTSTTQTEQSA